MAEFYKPDSGSGNPQSQITYQLPPGYLLSNKDGSFRYRITRVVGAGGFGITYEGLRNDGKRVAVKELFPTQIVARASDYSVLVRGDAKAFQKTMQSFYKEAKVLAQLKGITSVVEIYDYFYANNTAYYVMEYISGETMFHHMKKSGVLDAERYANSFRRLMEDLDQLHAQGVIHRDISPDNIMITESGLFKLIDFGSARAYVQGQNLTINVKRNFAPIEQYTSSGQGKYTDVYALAATMYYAFTGKLLPNATSRINNEEYTPAMFLGAKITERQEMALKKALAVKPANRYQSMQEFRNAYFDVPAAPPAPEPKPASGNRFRASLDMIREQPTFAIIGGACFLVALVLQILL